MHEFDAGYRNRRVSNTFEPQHRTQPKLDRSMVLFNQIIEVFRRSNLGAIAASMCGKKLPGRSMRSLIAIERNGARQAALTLERRRKKAFAAATSRLARKRKSTVFPLLSTAR